ncbi:MAG: hypothetical protein VB111_10670 [Clostridiaceae bacterium]|nr:hypothetical protein [Clostridiaceae bacterium]
MERYLRRHDIVYHAPADEPYDAMPIGEGDVAGLFDTVKNTLRFIANKSDLFDDTPHTAGSTRLGVKESKPDGDFGGWSAEWEEKGTALVSGGVLSMTDGTPALDPLYLQAYEQRLNLGLGRVELYAKTPFSEWTVTAYGSHDDHVVGFHVDTKTAFPVERTISLTKWGSRTLPHYYEHLLRDATVRLSGTESFAQGDCGYIRVKLSQEEYVIAAAVTKNGGEWHVQHPHEVAFTAPAAEAASFDVFLAIVTSEEADDPKSAACERVMKALSDAEATLKRSEADWKAFSGACFVKLQDDYLENLYYFHLYQMSISFRGRYPSMFNGSAFIWNHDLRNWGYFYHWNNQIPYWSLQSSNHMECFEPYARYRRAMLPSACRGAQKLGFDGAFYSDIANRSGGQAFEPDTANNLTCGPAIAMDLYRQWEYTLDDRYLEETAFPVMEACVRFYLSRVKRESDGVYHIESATVFESYLALKDTISDRAYIESLFRAYLYAVERLKKESAYEERVRDVLTHLYPYTIVERDGRRLISVGIRGDGKPMGFKEAVYPEGAGFGAEQAPLFPGNMPPEELMPILRDSFYEALKISPFQCGHTPYSVSAARLGIPVWELLRELVSETQIFPSGMSHFAKFAGDRNHAAMYTPRVLDGTETYTDWSRIHEQDEYSRTRVPKHQTLHAFLETMGQFNAAVNEALLHSELTADGSVIHVFPADESTELVMFMLRAKGGILVTAEKREGEVRYIALTAEHDIAAKVDIPWSGGTCATSGGETTYYEETASLEIPLQKDTPKILCPRKRQLCVLYQSMLDTDKPNTAVKYCKKAQLGIERQY